jgi:hypothetical protein
MTLSTKESETLDMFHALPVGAQKAINEAMRGVDDAFEKRGFKTAGDDRSARVEAAIIRLFIEANPDHAPKQTGDGE